MEAPGSDFWQSDEYLKRNAAGAHSNSHVIISELNKIGEAVEELESRLLKIERTIIAVGVAAVGSFLLLLLKFA